MTHFFPLFLGIFVYKYVIYHRCELLKKIGNTCVIVIIFGSLLNVLDAVCSSEDPFRRDEGASTDVLPAPTAVWLERDLRGAQQKTRVHYYTTKCLSNTPQIQFIPHHPSIYTPVPGSESESKIVKIGDTPSVWGADLTCQGQLWGLTSSPATTLLSTGGKVGRPHPQAGTKW